MPLVEKRYAEALVDIAVQQGNIDAFQQQFGSLVELVDGIPELGIFLQNPEIKPELKKEMLTGILAAHVAAELMNFVLLLVDKGRIGHLKGIFREFVRMADQKRNVLNMRILSAMPIEAAQVESLKEKYRKMYNAASVKAEVEVDTRLVGGVKVVIGDKVIDGTVKGRLEALRELIVNN